MCYPKSIWGAVIKSALKSGMNRQRFLNFLDFLSRIKKYKLVCKKFYKKAENWTDGNYEKLASAKGIKISCEISPEVEILGDELMISRLVDNFLSNALKFASTKTSLNLSASKTQTILSVKDDRAGISQKDSELIWNKFYQADSSRNKSLNAGSGLGLAIAANIAKIHGAKLGVKSEAGARSEFWAEFELAR